MYKRLLRPLLFRFQPETIHYIVFGMLKAGGYVPGVSTIVKWIFQYKHPTLHRNVFGIDFPNPVGLAAGMDKDAEVFDMLGYLGFGFVEVGTVTPKPQKGNPKPRLFRLKRDNALINRMGFNNKGVIDMVKRLRKKQSEVIIGGNIGKNKLTPNNEAVEDYKICFEALFPYVDYFVVNVSSPNTPGLRSLQEKEPLSRILNGLQQLNQRKKTPKPILLKIAADLTFEQIDEIIETVKSTGISGIVATNTTIARNNLSYSQKHIEDLGEGGLSGQPLRQRSTEIIRYITEKTDKTLPIIGVGGIMTTEDALEKIDAGAELIQIYTGFVYEGPAFVKQINKAILKNT